MENIFLGSSTEWKEELAKKVFHKIRIRIKGMFNGVSEVNQGWQHPWKRSSEMDRQMNINICRVSEMNMQNINA